MEGRGGAEHAREDRNIAERNERQRERTRRMHGGLVWLGTLGRVAGW